MIEKMKKDPILWVSGLLAVISCFIITPDLAYAEYVNWRVLAILGALMLVVGSLGNIGFFDYLTSKLLSSVKNQRMASIILVVLSFILSMFMTNDVTLVTLVPFALVTIGSFGDKKSLMYTLILMTCAANLGSMMTPIGNPQNLYLYTNYKMTLSEFLILMAPFTILSFVLIIAGCFILVKKGSGSSSAEIKPKPDALKTIICIVLFVVAFLSVIDVLHYLIMLAVIVAAMLILDRKSFLKVDYSLLITFVFFFILIGNLGRMDVIHNTISSVVDKAPVLTAVLSSQIISNVPAAMLLSAFTSDGKALVIGTNLGGLGTLIASMASLITYKIYIRDNKDGGKYIAAFSVVNVIMLVILYVFGDLLFF